MNKASNPQPLRIIRTPKLTLAVATTLLLAVVVVLLLAATPRPSQALLPGGMNLAPEMSVSKPSVVVTEGQMATNSGTFYDPADEDSGIRSNSVRITASVGTITQSGGYKNGIYSGTWSWSMVATKDQVLADQTKTVTITATDSRGASSKTSFSLTVNESSPPNDSFSGARELQLSPDTGTAGVTFLGGDTSRATMEAGEPLPHSPDKDCGIHGVSNTVWFKFTFPSQYSSHTLSINTGGSKFDTVLALYKGSSLDTLEQLECSNDNSIPNWNDKLSLAPGTLSVGQTYYLQLSGTGGARSGWYKLNICNPLGCHLLGQY